MAFPSQAQGDFCSMSNQKRSREYALIWLLGNDQR